MHRITELRESRGLSIRACALAAGLTPSTLFRAEKGERKLSMSQASTLALFFGVSVDYLLGKSPEEMYNGFVDSLHWDFMKEKIYEDGDVVQYLSEEVSEPTRSKMEVLFGMNGLHQSEFFHFLTTVIKRFSIEEDFSVKSKDFSAAMELKEKIFSLIAPITDTVSLGVLLALAQELNSKIGDGKK